MSQESSAQSRDVTPEPAAAAPPTDGEGYDYDVLIVGSGFGGAVSALRLTEKGYRVGVLEAGRRFTRATLPRNSWDLKNYLWAPALGLFGIQRIHLLGNVMVLAGRGRRRRLPQLRQHPVRAAEALLHRPPVGRHHRLAGRAEAVLRPGAEDARRAAQPDHHPLRRPPQGGRREDGRRRHLPHGARRGLLRRRQGRDGGEPRQARRGGPRPVLRRGRALAAGVQRVRRVHDGLPATAPRTPSTRTTCTSPRRPGPPSTP